MSDQLDVLKRVTAQLDALTIPYMVTGSLASSHYAIPRFTRDIDIVVELDEPAVSRLVRALQADFYVDESALRRAVAEPGMVNVIHSQLLVKVDFIVRKDTPYRREEFRRRRAAMLDDQTIWFVAPEDLVLSKLLWMRDTRSEIQRNDIEAIVSTVLDLDRDYIGRWATELGIAPIWKEVGDATR